MPQFLGDSSTLSTTEATFLQIQPPQHYEGSDLEILWRYLESGLDIIMTQEKFSYITYMKVYTMCYNYSTSSWKGPNGQSVDPDLYRRTVKYFTNYLMCIREDSEVLINEELLQYYADEWTHCTNRVHIVNKLFTFLNRHWVRRQRDEERTNIYPIYTLVLVLWRQIFFKHVQTKSAKIANIVIRQIEKQRNGEAIDQSLIKRTVDSFVTLGLDETDGNKLLLDVYRQRFEDLFIRTTERFYRNESDSFLLKNSLSDYLRLAEARLKQEEDRVEQHLNSCTREPLVAKCEDVLIRRHIEVFYADFEAFLDFDKGEDLRRMCTLLSRIPDGLVRPCKMFEERVKKCGLTAVAEVVGDPRSRSEANGNVESLEPKAYVESLTEVYCKNSDIVSKSLRGDACFVSSLDRACLEFVNNNCATASSSTKSPELLAKYADSLLQRRSRIGNVEKALNGILALYKYIYDKDVFQTFYMVRLSMRLILDLSTSEESEASMILKLKGACGYEYSNKLQHMLTDVSLSKDLTEEFKALDPGGSNFMFSIKVLGRNFWPLSTATNELHVPSDILPLYERFKNFYHAKYPGRNLTWLWKHSTNELRATYLGREYIFKTNSFQMAVLLQYNDHDILSLNELHIATGIDKDNLAVVLEHLLKAKILINAETDKYSLNLNFTSKKIRIKLDLPKDADFKTEESNILMSVDEDRKYILQAMVVRIMKARKTLDHQPLVQEVISQVSHRFKPNVSGIKRAIDMLLEKEFLARVDGTRDTFVYVP